MSRSRHPNIDSERGASPAGRGSRIIHARITLILHDSSAKMIIPMPTGLGTHGHHDIIVQGSKPVSALHEPSTPPHYARP